MKQQNFGVSNARKVYLDRIARNRLKTDENTSKNDSQGFSFFFHSSFWIAVGTIGLLLLALYATFLSPFSEMIETELRYQNQSLREEKSQLTEEISNLALRKRLIEKNTDELKKSSLVLSSEKINLEKELIKLRDRSYRISQESKQLVSKNKELEETRRKIAKELQRQYKTYYLSLLPSEAGERLMPKYNRRMANAALDTIRSRRNGEVLDANHLSYIRTGIGDDAYDGLKEFLYSINKMATNEFQKMSYSEIYEAFENKCGDRNVFDRIYNQYSELTVPDTELDPESENLSGQGELSIRFAYIEAVKRTEKFCLGIVN